MTAVRAVVSEQDRSLSEEFESPSLTQVTPQHRVPSDFFLTTFCSVLAKCMATNTVNDASLYEHLLRILERAAALDGRADMVRLLRDLENVSFQLRTYALPLSSHAMASVAAYDNYVDADLLGDRKSAELLYSLRPSFSLEHTLMNEEGLDEVLHEPLEDGDDGEEYNAKLIKKYFCPQAMQLSMLANVAEIPLRREELFVVSASINRLANARLRPHNLRSIRFWGKILLTSSSQQCRSRNAAEQTTLGAAYYIAEADLPPNSALWSACDELSATYEQAFDDAVREEKNSFKSRHRQFETFHMRGQNQMELSAVYMNRAEPPEKPPHILKQAVKQNFSDSFQWPELPPLPRTRDIIQQEYNYIIKGKNPADVDPEIEERRAIPPDRSATSGTNRYIYYCTSNLAGDQWRMLPHASSRAIRQARQSVNYSFTGNLDRHIFASGSGRYYGKECEYLRSQVARISHGCMLAPQNYVQTEELDDAEGATEFVDNPEFETPALREILDQKLDFFIHSRPFLYKQGRCAFIDINNENDDENDEANNLDDEELDAVLGMLGLEQPPPPARKVSDLTLLEPELDDTPQPTAAIGDDVQISNTTAFSVAGAEFAPQRPWTTRTTNFLLPELASVVAKSVVWPGACFVYQQQNQFENFYVGFGTKNILGGDSLMPKEKMLTQVEFQERPATIEPETLSTVLQEHDDPAVEVEIEHAKMLEKKRAGEEDEEGADGEEAEEEEGDDEDEQY